jgi:hypothetical protein
LKFEDVPDRSALADWLDTADGVDAMRLVSDMWRSIEAEAVEADAVALVLAYDFAAAVQRRLPPGAPPYDLPRLDGVVGGKTMASPEGGVEVVVHAPLVLDTGSGAADDRGRWVELMRYTAKHEAQHVGMHQRGEATREGAGQRLGEGQAHAYLCESAGAVLEEYRAELVSAAVMPRATPYWRGVPGALGTLGPRLRRALAEHRPGEPWLGTAVAAFSVTHDAWTAMAYLAANQGATGDPHALPAELRADPHWQRYAAPHWDEFATFCERAPRGDEAALTEELDGLVLDLAELFDEWFETVGFALRDTPQGMYFQVIRQDF